MFFVGIFGVDRKDKKIRDTHAPCPICNDTNAKWVIRRESRFTFFFIPILHWGTEYFSVCQNCKSVFSIAKAKGDQHEHSKADQLTYWDLKVLKKGQVDRHCPNCNALVTEEHQYCHKCGQAL